MEKLLNKDQLPLNIGDIYFKCIPDYNNKNYEVLNSGYVVGINKDNNKKGVLYFSMRSNNEIWQYQDQKIENIRESYKYFCTNVKEYDVSKCHYELKDYILSKPQTVKSLVDELIEKHPKITLDTQIYIKNKNNKYDWFRNAECINKYYKDRIISEWWYTQKGNLRIDLEKV